MSFKPMFNMPVTEPMAEVESDDTESIGLSGPEDDSQVEAYNPGGQ